MASRNRQGLKRWSRSLRTLVILLGAALLPASCLTPDFQFDGGPNPGTSGGNGNGGAGPSTEHCENRKKDADESDTDCGGIDCEPCGLGRSCAAGSDCQNGSCTDGRCQDPSCTDDIKNSGETDVDCGGESCPPCADAKRCGDDPDCESRVCKASVCSAPSCGDRVKNGNELDIDCGGSCDPCDAGQACVLDEDCEPPPAEDPATVDCLDQVCTLICVLGAGDCNQKAADGCETNLNTDAQHCGSCDEACDLPNTMAVKCQGGTCAIDFENGGCDPGFADCDGDPTTGCEANLNTDEGHCGSCNAACSDAGGEPTCSGGNCTITCDAGHADCDNDARSNGCEIDTDSDALNCGDCDEVCPTGSVNESRFCAAGECGLTTCTNGKGDCDGNTTCTDDLNTTTNCGTCGNSCSASNATAVCVNPGSGFACDVGVCNDTAQEDFEDCDGSYLNGCEVDVNVSVTRCGGCLSSDLNPGSGADCNALKNNTSLHIAAITCDEGGCRITGCTGNYADCDGSAQNGCEVNTATDDGRCGGCLAGDANSGSGVACNSVWANATGNCADSTCEFVACGSNHGDCNSSLADGCEIDLRTDEAHCGACGAACQTNSVTSTNTCTSKVCGPVCSGAGQNCDSNAWNGCEDKNNDESNCGTCGNVCAVPTGTSSNTCSSGSCAPSCSAPSSRWQNCDASGSNGCEDKNNDESNCGACGTTCQTNTGTSANTCTTGACVPTCSSANYLNCDSNAGNGCETDKRTSTTNCGACGNHCGGAAQTNVASASCSSSSCNVTCNSGYCPDSSSAKLCTAPLGTAQNCLSCGNVCTGGTPYCTGSGCLDHLQINLISTTGFSSGKDANGDLIFNHSLTTSRATNSTRAVVLLIGYSGNLVDLPPPVTYNGTSMLSALQLGSGNHVWAGIYYLRDASLPASAGSYSININGNLNNTEGWMAQVVELTNVDQDATIRTVSSTGSGGCGAADLPVTSVPTDSYAFSLLSVFSAASFTAQDSQTLIREIPTTNGETVYGYRANVSGSVDMGWTCGSTVNSWVQAAAAFPPEGTP